MDIVFLGSGNLANPLKNFLIQKHNVEIIPLTHTKKSSFEQFVYGLKSETVFIDLMDPNKIDSNTNFELIEKAITFRKIVFKSLLIKQYIYFSSANLYSPSYEKIFERDQTIDQPKDTYLILKKETESSLKNNSLPLSVCRTPNVWGHDSKDSFFSDLLHAHKTKINIGYKKGDKNVISFINIFDLANLLNLIIDLEMLGIINFSTDSYDSRFNLKAKVNSQETRIISNQKGIRLSSEKLNWEKIFKKNRLPF